MENCTNVLGRAGVRQAGVAGIAGTVLLAVALLLGGSPPRTDQPTREILASMVAHRSALLLGGYLAAVAMFGLLWFIAGAWGVLRVSERRTMLQAGVLSGVAGLAIMLAGVLIVSGLAVQAVGSRELLSVRLIADTSNIFVQVGLMGLATFALAASLAGRARGLPGWVVALGVLGWGAVVSTSLPAFLARGGVWEFGGPVVLAASVPLAAWMVVLAILMTKPDQRLGDLVVAEA